MSEAFPHRPRPRLTPTPPPAHCLNADANPNPQLKAKLKGKQEMCVTLLEDNSQKMQNLGTLPLDQHEQYKV